MQEQVPIISGFYITGIFTHSELHGERFSLEQMMFVQLV
jgi:hypothetical protein